MNNFDEIALKIDEGMDSNDPNIVHQALDEVDKFLQLEKSSKHSVLYYYRANAFAALRRMNPNYSNDQFNWEQPELSEEIFSLRKAVDNNGFFELDSIRCCRIYTNLGNALNTVGRHIEALASFDNALKILPMFAMAAANRAYCLTNYSDALYDSAHRCIFLGEAVKGFKIALNDDAVWDCEYPDTVKIQFQEKLREIETYLSKNCDLKNYYPMSFEMEGTAEAIALNNWRLKNRLFLNPLNDLGNLPIATHDVFHLPNHTYQIAKQRPRFVEFYDLIKQEYVAACVLMHEGISDDNVHPADQSLLTFEHADYSVTSIETEKQKAAFRLAYSLLDKCAVFINEYFLLGHKSTSLATSFRKVWYNSKGKHKQLHAKLPIRNWRLRALFAVSLDLFDKDISELTSPLATSVNSFRNASEHRFVSIHEMSLYKEEDDLVERITISELQDLTLHLLKLARSTIMGLSFAVHHQELYLAERKDDEISVPFINEPKVRR